MGIVSEIRTQFSDIEADLSLKEFEAIRDARPDLEAQWKHRRELNTHAYFLFLFTRLENHILNHTEAFITAKKTSLTHWQDRAIWEIPDDRLHFKKRVALLTQSGNTDFNKIVEYYRLRNDIAHGNTIPDITSAINMIAVFSDMDHFFNNLISPLALVTTSTITPLTP